MNAAAVAGLRQADDIDRALFPRHANAVNGDLGIVQGTAHMAKLTAREELITLAASICVAAVLVIMIAGMTLANTVHQINPATTGAVSGLATSPAKAPGKA